jgi:hypothetical protein
MNEQRPFPILRQGAVANAVFVAYRVDPLKSVEKCGDLGIIEKSKHRLERQLRYFMRKEITGGSVEFFTVRVKMPSMHFALCLCFLCYNRFILEECV